LESPVMYRTHISIYIRMASPIATCTHKSIALPLLFLGTNKKFTTGSRAHTHMTRIDRFPEPAGVPQLHLTYTHAYVLDAVVPNWILCKADREQEDWGCFGKRPKQRHCREILHTLYIGEKAVIVGNKTYPFPSGPEHAFTHRLEANTDTEPTVKLCLLTIAVVILGLALIGAAASLTMIFLIRPQEFHKFTQAPVAPAHPAIAVTSDHLIDGVLWSGYTRETLHRHPRIILGNDFDCALHASPRGLYIISKRKAITATVGAFEVKAGESPVSHLDMQADGNLVLYDTAEKAVWASGTHGLSIAGVRLAADCSGLEFIQKSGTPIADIAPVFPRNLDLNPTCTNLKNCVAGFN